MSARLLSAALALPLLGACSEEPAAPKPDPMKECRRIMTDILVAVQKYDDENGTYPPSGIEGLMETLRKNGPDGKPYHPFKEGPNDPWGTPWFYVNNVDGSAPEGWSQFEPYAVYSAGPNREDEKGEGDDVASWKLN